MSSILNPGLVVTQKITEKQEETLHNIYKELGVLLRKEEQETDLSYPKNREYVEKLKALEFKLQENWNFPKDDNYHTYWNMWKHCSCPKGDNAERHGFEKIINCNCPMHGYLGTDG